MIEGTISNPVFVDLEKTTVKFTLTRENGAVSEVQLSVPADFARGVNPYWDEILDNFDVEEMRKARNDLERRIRKEQEWKRNKNIAAAESQKLRELFSAKTQAFKLPYIAEASDDIKSAIRRSSDSFMLNAILQAQMATYMQENNMNFVELLDHLEDYKEAKEAEAAAAAEAAKAAESQQP